VDFLIDSRLAGSNKHIHFNNDVLNLITEKPANVFSLCVNSPLENDLISLLRVSCIELDLEPPTAFSGPMRQIHPEGFVPWGRIMPRKDYKKFLEGLVQSVRAGLERATIDYYRNIWLPQQRLLDVLQPAAINVRRLKEALSSNENESTLRTFEPIDGFAKKVLYDRFATRTGRLGVAAGPHVLTLKKSLRNIVTSAYGRSGTVVSLDFNALEARIILYASGKQPDGSDLYTQLATKALSGVDRSTAKVCVIADLYGISQRRLADKLQISVGMAENFTASIRKYFGTHDTISRLRQQYNSENCIYNHYGRRLKVPDGSDSTLLNTYAQSTGADVAQLGFLKLLDILPPSARPLFVLHDALIIDVKKDELQAVESIKEIVVDGYTQPFFLKCEKFYTPPPNEGTV